MRMVSQGRTRSNRRSNILTRHSAMWAIRFQCQTKDKQKLARDPRRIHRTLKGVMPVVPAALPGPYLSHGCFLLARNVHLSYRPHHCPQIYRQKIRNILREDQIETEAVMYDQPRKETRGRKPMEYPESMVKDAIRYLREGNVPPSYVYSLAGFPSEHGCRKAVSRYLFSGNTVYTWIQLSAYIAVKAMQETPDDPTIPTILCGDCPMFRPDKSLTRMSDGRYIRFGKCTDTQARVERCSHCVYEKRKPDANPPEKAGYHINE